MHRALAAASLRRLWVRPKPQDLPVSLPLATPKGTIAGAPESTATSAISIVLVVVTFASTFVASVAALRSRSRKSDEAAGTAPPVAPAEEQHQAVAAGPFLESFRPGERKARGRAPVGGAGARKARRVAADGTVTLWGLSESVPGRAPAWQRLEGSADAAGSEADAQHAACNEPLRSLKALPPPRSPASPRPVLTSVKAAGTQGYMAMVRTYHEKKNKRNNAVLSSGAAAAAAFKFPGYSVPPLPEAAQGGCEEAPPAPIARAAPHVTPLNEAALSADEPPSERVEDFEAAASSILEDSSLPPRDDGTAARTGHDGMQTAAGGSTTPGGAGGADDAIARLARKALGGGGGKGGQRGPARAR